MSPHEIIEEYFLDKIGEKPEVQLEELIKDKSLDDEWIKKQQDEIEQEELKKVFNKANEADFEEIAKDSV